MFKCEGKKSFKKFDEVGTEFCPFYFEWDCKGCKHYKGGKRVKDGD